MRATALLAAALALSLAVTGCTAESAKPPQPELRETTPTPGPPEEQTMVALADMKITLEQVAEGFEQPLWLTHAGDGSGRLFIAEQVGRVVVLRDGRRQEGVFLDVTDRITSGGERGLLGLAFPPDYEESGRFYVNYTDLQGDSIVARFTAEDPSSDTPQLDGPEVLLTVEQPFPNHNGGSTVFGPDGMLWVGLGDGGGAGDPDNNAQDMDTYLGKLVRMDVSGDEAAPPQDAPGDGDPLIRHLGLRNPWRFSFDRETSDLWIADVGQNAVEEINFVAGDDNERHNFGWRLWEGSEPFQPGSDPEREGFIFPIHEYTLVGGQSITGGYVYRGSQYPALSGTYFFGDFVEGWLAGLQRTGPDGDVLDEPETRRLLEGVGNISSFGEDEDGELYVIDHGGTIQRITAE